MSVCFLNNTIEYYFNNFNKKFFKVFLRTKKLKVFEVFRCEKLFDKQLLFKVRIYKKMYFSGRMGIPVHNLFR